MLKDEYSIEKMDGKLEITELLYQLGITPNYKGFFFIQYALYLVKENPENLLMVTKWLYPAVAHHYGTTPACVERNIRTVIHCAWEENQPMFEKLAHRELTACPTVSKFLSMLGLYFF